jgi:putative ABC transport system substrate-binding protein
MPVIGFLNSGSADAYPDRITAFREGLRQLGYVDGENVIIDYRWALGQYDRLPAFAAELVGRRVSVLVATGGEPAALAARSATSTIPIVFAIGGDPIKLGLVASYNRPGGNATGANILAAEMDSKRLGLLHELMPSATRVGVLLDPNFPAYTEQLNDVQHAARMINLEVELLRANTDGEIETAFESSSQKRLEALVLAASPFFDNLFAPCQLLLIIIDNEHML